MRSLDQFIKESMYDENIENEFFFENIFTEENNMTLEEVYESIFDKMFMVNESTGEMEINEGVLGKLGKFLSKMGEKAEKGDEKIKEKVDKASDAAKKAIANAKEKAGKAWDKVKDVYANVVTSIDSAIQSTKKGMQDIITTAGMKLEEFETKAAQVYANAIAQGTKAGKAVIEWVNDKTEGVKKIGAMNAMLIGAMMASKAGLDSNVALEILSAAGFK